MHGSGWRRRMQTGSGGWQVDWPQRRIRRRDDCQGEGERLMDEDRPDGDWWRGCVIYQVYPRSFQDTTGDGSGDLKGITQRLGHIASLGVDAVWLSPFFKSPMADMGYDVSDYCDVDPMFGTLEDFDALVAEAHRLGLKIIIDQVLSHSSDQHPWFIESRASRDNPQGRLVCLGRSQAGRHGAEQLAVGLRRPGLGVGFDAPAVLPAQFPRLAARPQLPQSGGAGCAARHGALLARPRRRRLPARYGELLCPRPLAARQSAARRERGRHDRPRPTPTSTRTHLFDKTQPENLAFLKRFRALLDEYEDRASVGEVGDEDRSLQTVAAYTRGGDRLHMCYTFDLLGPKFSAAHVRGCVEAFEAAVADGWVCWAFSNHDVVRHVSRWTRPGGDTDAVARFSIALLACLRGSICLYQGEELGLDGGGHRLRGSARSLSASASGRASRAGTAAARRWPGRRRQRMPASRRQSPGCRSAGATAPARSTSRTADPHSVLARYREVLAFRKRHPALRLGSIAFLDAPENVLAFVREADGERLLCAFNFGGEPSTGHCRPASARSEMICSTARDAQRMAALTLAPLGVFVGRRSAESRKNGEVAAAPISELTTQTAGIRATTLGHAAVVLNLQMHMSSVAVHDRRLVPDRFALECRTRPAFGRQNNRHVS